MPAAPCHHQAVSREVREQKAVAHAIDVMVAMQSEQYHRFFLLYDTAPNMGGYIMDLFMGMMRHVALKQMCRAYRPDLPLPFVLKELSFIDAGELQEYLCAAKAVCKVGEDTVDVMSIADIADCVLDAKASQAACQQGYVFQVMDGDSVGVAKT